MDLNIHYYNIVVMDLIVEADIYTPSIDDNGNYIDKVPSFNNIKNGLRCPCGTRKDKTYDCSSYFTTHIKTQTHKKWLSNMNYNKSNYYIENIDLRETIHNQKIIISKYEKEINTKQKTINYLTEQLVLQHNLNQSIDLINFD
jgi:hypothetical protein